MKIQHTVVFRLIHARGSKEERDFLEAGRRTLTGIAEVTQFAVNNQVSAKSELTHQFTMVFADQGAYDAYNAHPAHVDFVENRWAAEVEMFQEYDFIQL